MFFKSKLKSPFGGCRPRDLPTKATRRVRNQQLLEADESAYSSDGDSDAAYEENVERVLGLDVNSTRTDGADWGSGRATKLTPRESNSTFWVVPCLCLSAWPPWTEPFLELVAITVLMGERSGGKKITDRDSDIER
jgi:hypothetical protein